MAKKSVIESPPSASEEESSSEEEHQVKERKHESTSHTQTTTAEESGEETDEGDSEYEESDENNEAEESKSKSQSQQSANKIHEEYDGSSEAEEETDEESKEDNEAEGSSDSEEEEEEESNEDNAIEAPKPNPSFEGSHPSKEIEPVDGNDRGKKSNDSNTKLNTEDGDTRKNFFARVWSLDDEKTLLNSMLEFRSRDGKDVDSSSIETFSEFLKGKLSFTDEPKPRQVSDKIKFLKRKYFGKAMSHLTKDHDIEMKDISSQVWLSNVKTKSLKRRHSLLEEEISKKFGLGKRPEFNDNEDKLAALEKRLLKQKRFKIKLDIKRMDLISETYKLISKGIHKSYGD